MPACKTPKKTAKILSLCAAIGVGFLTSGCADDPLVDPYVIPQPQSFIPTDTEFALPPNQQTSQQTNQQISINNEASDTYLALQRLQPATHYDFTVISDGATGTEVINYRNSVLVDEGDDSVLLTNHLPNTQIEACLYQDNLYLCLRVFENFDVSQPVPGGISLFTLDENGFGSGVFALCPDIHRNPDSCTNQISNNTPTGTLLASAGILSQSSVSGQNPLYDGGDYSLYLARSNPSITTDFIQPSAQLLNKARTFITF